MFRPFQQHSKHLLFTKHYTYSEVYSEKIPQICTDIPEIVNALTSIEKFPSNSKAAKLLQTWNSPFKRELFRRIISPLLPLQLRPLPLLMHLLLLTLSACHGSLWEHQTSSTLPKWSVKFIGSSTLFSVRYFRKAS